MSELSKAVLSEHIVTLMTKGMTVAEAIDEVFGEGSFMQLVAKMGNK